MAALDSRHVPCAQLLTGQIPEQARQLLPASSRSARSPSARPSCASLCSSCPRSRAASPAACAAARLCASSCRSRAASCCRSSAADLAPDSACAATSGWGSLYEWVHVVGRLQVLRPHKEQVFARGGLGEAACAGGAAVPGAGTARPGGPAAPPQPASCAKQLAPLLACEPAGTHTAGHLGT
jgi:hypothetical protein